jgi:hypothetical protein
MPRVSKLALPPIDWGKETIGQRVARFRKERGSTQPPELGLCKRSSPTTRTTACASPPKWLSASPTAKASGRKTSRKVLRRLEQIEALPPMQQTTLLRTIDTFLEVAALKTARRS